MDPSGDPRCYIGINRHKANKVVDYKNIIQTSTKWWTDDDFKAGADAIITKGMSTGK